MAIYEFECRFCAKITEHHFKMAECPEEVRCPACQHGMARKILSVPGIQCDDAVNVTWLDEAARNASNDHRHGRKKIETRAQYKQYLKDNGLRPWTSGDINRSEV